MPPPTTKNSRKGALSKKNKATAKTKKSKTVAETKLLDHHPLVKSLAILDPLLQFLTKRSGKTSVPLTLLQGVLPFNNSNKGKENPQQDSTNNNEQSQSQHPASILLQHIPELVELGILKLTNKGKKQTPTDATLSSMLAWDTSWEIGFPAPPMEVDDSDDWTDGFRKRKLPSNKQIMQQAGSLCGSTKTAAKRRMAALKRSLKENCKNSDGGKVDNNSKVDADAMKETLANNDNDILNEESLDNEIADDANGDGLKRKHWDFESHQDTSHNDDENGIDPTMEEELTQEARKARNDLQAMFQFKDRPLSREKKKKRQEHLATASTTSSKFSIPEYILPRQASYAGSHAAQTSTFADLSANTRSKIPDTILKAFGVSENDSNGASTHHKKGRRLYSHQVKAITSAMNGQHTLVCTSTGSGKSLCFLIPVLAAAYNASKNGGEPDTNNNSNHGISIIMFPTKALAQDQLRKLVTLVNQHPDLAAHIRPATLDGDCPHEQRSHISKTANIILTNPDTLHASILPQWKKLYKRILLGLHYVVIDESHVYEGMFGTHVALVLSRLQRLCMIARCEENQTGPLTTPTFLASSATLEHPTYHFRLLCPIANVSDITVLTSKDDGSPRSAKHFFVWNPPLLSMTGENTESVFYPKETRKQDTTKTNGKDNKKTVTRQTMDASGNRFPEIATDEMEPSKAKISEHARTSIPTHHRIDGLRRRHAADETALLLSRAIICNVRCIAFCKTRSVVEWVYERTVAALRSQASTEHLVEQVQPYRGGYKKSDRRDIEKKLFEGKLVGVVATSALELGVDIGGIDLTLHVGYPASISSLLQQAGRAGRGGSAAERSSLSVVVAFGSPAEQYLWKKPECLLSRGISSPRSFPINAGVVSGHLLCASKEFPVTGHLPATKLCASGPGSMAFDLPDQELFGSAETYNEAMAALLGSSSVVQIETPVASGEKVKAYRAHAFIDKPWMKVSIRSVEPVSFSIVDVSHPLQGGQMDGIQDEQAVLDNLPYSRVFYHAFPGAIILHRGQRYKVVSVTRPPPYDPTCVYRRNLNLAAFAKPTQDKYLTRPLSTQTITVVKQIERVDLVGVTPPSGTTETEPNVSEIGNPFTDLPDQTEGSFAGCGVVTAKRTVHGYKKLSMITRVELSRHELQLPDMEYDTFGLWIDAEAECLAHFLGDDYGAGVHALSHALLAVAPLFVACARSDLECDHASYSPTRVCLFDERAGGSGTCAELWKSLFVPNGLLESAIDLLANCPSCHQEGNDLGCPACLQSCQCTKFNQDLSRSAALTIGRRMLKRLKQTKLYKESESPSESRSEEEVTPRKKARSQALRHAKDLSSARGRLFVVGRPSWPTDQRSARYQESTDE